MYGPDGELHGEEQPKTYYAPQRFTGCRARVSHSIAILDEQRPRKFILTMNHRTLS